MRHQRVVIKLSKWVLSALLSITLVVSGSEALAADNADIETLKTIIDDEAEYAEGEVLVVFKEQVSNVQAAASFAQ